MISCALFISLLLQVILSSQYTDAFFVWTAPPPAWNQTVAGSNNVQTAVIRVLQGTTNYQVTWKYNLLGSQTIRLKQFSIRHGSGVPDDIGDVIDASSTLYNRHNYSTRFRLNSTSKFSTLTINRITQKENATFQCRMQEGGNTWAYNVRIEVIAPPVITSPTNDTWEIMAGESVTIECLAESDPSSSYVWKNTTGAVVADGRQLRLHKVNDSSGGNYICTATNKLGSDDRSIIVLVRRIKIYGTLAVDSEFKLGMEDISSDVAKEFAEPFKKEFDKLNSNTAGFDKSEFLKYRNGSIIVYFVLHFSHRVSTNEGTLQIKNAVEKGAIGSYQVKNFKTIEEFEVNPTTSPSVGSIATHSSTASISPGKRVNKDTSAGPPWIIIGAAAGGAVLVIAIIVLLICCLRKDNKKGGSEALARENEIEHSAVEEHTHEQKPVKKPGETLYAELRDLDQRQRPNKPSYPDALPPVKRPSPYERTDYAEITHFIKGDVNGQQQMWSPNGTKEPWIGMQMFC
ncbi:uncharacterized protein [Porites lutea]|uniref:uncharacterized protein isoform X5 n=1 Tax=Porites lutea TaxID=51062 RepID=UPI003CC62D7F